MRKETRLEFLHALIAASPYTTQGLKETNISTLRGAVFVGQQTGLIPKLYTFHYSSKGYGTPYVPDMDRDLIMLYKRGIVGEPCPLTGRIEIHRMPNRIPKYVHFLSETIQRECPDKFDLFNLAVYLEARRKGRKLSWDAESLERFEDIKQVLKAFAA